MSRLLAVAIASSLAVAVAVTPAAAAPGWNPPLEGAELTSHSPQQPQVVLDAAGNAAMAWTRYDPDSGKSLVETRIVPADGPSGPAIRLSALGISADSPDVAIAPDGRAVAVWREGGDIVASVRPPGGQFGPGQALSKPAGETGVTADVELDAAGNATVLWTTFEDFAWRVRTTAIAAGAVNGPTTLVHMEATAQLLEPALAVDPAGNAHGIWVRSQVSGGDRTTTIQRAHRPVDGGFAYQGDLDSNLESPYNMEIPTGLRAPQIAVDAGGGAVATWIRGGFPSAIRWSAGPAVGAWPAATPLGGPETLGAPVLATTAAGDALIAGVSASAAPRRLWIARRPAGGTFGPQEPVADTAVHSVSDLSVSAGGATALTWLTHDGTAYRARAAYRPALGAAWVATALGAATPSLYAGTLLPTAAVNASGDAAVAWSAGTPNNFRTLLARYEVAQPATDGPGIGPSVDAIAPTIANLRLKPRRFAVAGGRPAGKRRVARGATLRFRLSERARVRIRIDRLQRGRRAGRRCRVAAKSGRRCVVRRHAGTIVRRNRPAGANRIRLNGRIGRRALRPGRYRATVVAIDAAGNRSKPRRVSFRIVRAR